MAFTQEIERAIAVIAIAQFTGRNAADLLFIRSAEMDLIRRIPVAVAGHVGAT
ncbi:hypothetical protein D1872_328360 [compost metagenome]